jgi:hypothetical protein
VPTGFEAKTETKTSKHPSIKDFIFYVSHFLPIWPKPNTDWSIAGDHNVKRILPESGPSIGVPYDFDYAGIVNTHYAIPIRVAKTVSTKDRFYQGYCQSPEVFVQIFARFQKHKQEIFSLYKNFPLISKKYKKKIFKFLEKFYKIINSPRLIKSYILDNCVQKTLFF